MKSTRRSPTDRTTSPGTTTDDDAIQSGGPLPVSPEDGLAAGGVCEAAYESAATGQAVAL